MATTTDKRMIIQAAPFAWMHRIWVDNETLKCTETYRFDNLSSPATFVIPTVNASGEQEYQEITRADGAIIQFPAWKLTIDGTNEGITEGATTNTPATMSIETNEAPLPTSINSFSAWLADLEAKVGEYWLVTIPIGFTNNSRGLATPKVDGYAFMIGKIVSNIEPADDAGVRKVKIDFEGQDMSGGQVPGLANNDGEFLHTGTPKNVIWSEIVWKGKTTAFKPDDFISADSVKLIQGKILIKSANTYTYGS